MTVYSEIQMIAPQIDTEGQLVIPESTEGLTLADFVPVLKQYKDINASLVFDYRDRKGNKDARSHVAKLRKVKAPINEIHKNLKASYKAIVDQMDSDKRETLGIVEEMIEFHDKELRIVAEEEKVEAERKASEQEVIDCWDIAHEMNDMEDQKRELARQKAEQDRIATEQHAENERLRIEREKKEAAEKAAEEARLAEQARAAREIKEAEEKAAREKAEAEERTRKAIEDAERKAKDAEARAAKEKADAEAKIKAEEERKRIEEEQAKADVENIKRVHWLIIPALQKIGLSEDLAKSAIVAIREGKIPAVSIDYQWVDESFPV